MHDACRNGSKGRLSLFIICPRSSQRLIRERGGPSLQRPLLASERLSYFGALGLCLEFAFYSCKLQIGSILGENRKYLYSICYLRYVSTEPSTHNGNGKSRPNIQGNIMMAAYRNHFISLPEARHIAGNDRSASMALWRLTKKGNLLRVKEGLFAAMPLEMNGQHFEVNRYALFDKAMKSEGGLAYHSALELHGAAYSMHSKLYYLTTRKVKPFEFQDILYRSVWAPDIFGMTTVWTDGDQVNVTDKERTFLDCLRRLDLCGGLEEYLKSVESFTILDQDRLIEYLNRFGERSLVQRTGMILTILGERIKLSEPLMKSLRSQVRGNPCYLVPARKKAKSVLNKEWQVYVPVNLEELMRNV